MCAGGDHATSTVDDETSEQDYRSLRLGTLTNAVGRDIQEGDDEVSFTAMSKNAFLPGESAHVSPSNRLETHLVCEPQTVFFTIGNHRLTGKKVTLKKPLAIIHKSTDEEGHRGSVQEEALGMRGACSPIPFTHPHRYLTRPLSYCTYRSFQVSVQGTS